MIATDAFRAVRFDEIAAASPELLEDYIEKDDANICDEYSAFCSYLIANIVPIAATGHENSMRVIILGIIAHGMNIMIANPIAGNNRSLTAAVR